MTSTVAAAGGQYAQAKHIIGPLMAFNVGLFLVFAYTMLEAGNAITVGFLVDTVAKMAGHEGVDQRPFIVLSIMFLAWLNYRGVLATLTFSLVITAFAFVAILVLFFAVQPWSADSPLRHAELISKELPYGWLGVLAAMHFGLWFYLGVEGTTQAAEEVRSPSRALPYGTMASMMTLAIAATLTWYVCAGLMPWEYLGQAGVPLFDAARLTGSTFLMWLLGIGTLFATLASANGCINDASRAWFSLGRDHYLPAWFGAVHPKYRTPYRSIIFLVPVAMLFALQVPLDQVITFSILSGLLGLHVHADQHDHVPQEVAAGHHQAWLRPSHASAAGTRADRAVRVDVLRGVPGIWHAAHRHDDVLHRGVAVVPLLALPLREAQRPVHDALATARRVLSANVSINVWPALVPAIRIPGEA